MSEISLFSRCLSLSTLSFLHPFLLFSSSPYPLGSPHSPYSFTFRHLAWPSSFLYHCHSLLLYSFPIPPPIRHSLFLAIPASPFLTCIGNKPYRTTIKLIAILPSHLGHTSPYFVFCAVRYFRRITSFAFLCLLPENSTPPFLFFFLFFFLRSFSLLKEILVPALFHPHQTSKKPKKNKRTLEDTHTLNHLCLSYRRCRKANKKERQRQSTQSHNHTIASWNYNKRRQIGNKGGWLLFLFGLGIPSLPSFVVSFISTSIHSFFFLFSHSFISSIPTCVNANDLSITYVQNLSLGLAN